MTLTQRNSLGAIYRTLDALEVKGKNNLASVIGCMNELEKLLAEPDGKEETTDGNSNA